MSIRQPIITVCGHVDHGKTSLLDSIRGTSLQEQEAGGITQKISFTKYPFEQLIKVCPLIEKNKIELKIPGFLFIDTPGHAAFTNLRKRGGSLADIAILVVDIREGIKPQTAEVISILKSNKTPFIIALNKIDALSGWYRRESIKESIELLPEHVRETFEVLLGTFQASMHDHGFETELFYNISDFTKNIAIVPCSARTKEGISEVLFVLTGLSQKFLAEKLKVSKETKGVLLEIKKEKSTESTEAIIYDGVLREGDEIVIASLTGKPVISKIRGLEEVLPLSTKFKAVKEATAATGIRLQLTNREDILSGMPFQKIDNNIHEVVEKFKKEFEQTIKLDKEGIIIKADSLGSLEALLTLLREANITVVKAGIGSIGKTDIVSAKANLELNPLNAVILGFNVSIENDLQTGHIKILTHPVVYKLIEEVVEWREKQSKKIEKDRLMELATICKLEILHKYQFRNSNPAIFGARVLAGVLKKNIPLIDETGIEVARVKAIESDKKTVDESTEGMEIALSLPGVNFERQLADKKYLYSYISESQMKQFSKSRDLLSSNELKVLSEISEIKEKLALKKR